MKPVKMIFATDENCVFGRTDNTLPFKCKADMKHFKEYTKGHILVMGANTFKSLPKKLEGRVNVVYGSFSRGIIDIKTLSGEKPDLRINSDTVTVRDIPHCLENLSRAFDGDIIFIGGVNLLVEAFKAGIINEVSSTSIDGEHEGDISCDELVDLITAQDISKLKHVSMTFEDGCVIINYKYKGKSDEKFN
jgi:dihydrofolate reductase